MLFWFIAVHYADYSSAFSHFRTIISSYHIVSPRILSGIFGVLVTKSAARVGQEMSVDFFMRHVSWALRFERQCLYTSGTGHVMHVGNPTCRRYTLDVGKSVTPSAG